MCCSGNVDVLQWNRTWFFFWHVQFHSGFHVMTVNEISCNWPEFMFSFRIISCWVILMWWWRRESAWFSWKKFLVPILFQGNPWLRWMVSDVDLLQKVLTVPSATGKIKLSPFIGVNTSSALSLLAWSSDASICSNSSMSATITSPFQIPPRATHIQRIYLAKLLDQTDVISIGLSQK